MSATLISWNDRGHEVPIEKIEEGLWIETESGVPHRLLNTFPLKCEVCGFPTMEIIDRNLQKRTVSLECPWCNNRTKYSPERPKVIEVTMEAISVRLTDIEVR